MALFLRVHAAWSGSARALSTSPRKKKRWVTRGLLYGAAASAFGGGIYYWRASPIERRKMRVVVEGAMRFMRYRLGPERSGRGVRGM